MSSLQSRAAEDAVEPVTGTAITRSAQSCLLDGNADVTLAARQRSVDTSCRYARELCRYARELMQLETYSLPTGEYVSKCIKGHSRN
jgi:hypothetical protein